ncbi:tetratricopeptide repeat protein [Muricauda sp. MAR_2010_75]|uniref:tetratricopeptide repeat protein n=1 Tax=Allomuricauda sp. MAR_2010_75 TaxID=1250232 RepID=UPI0009DD69BF|nr:tetratricopeptide repeat protein [Muricauda sp. MAR_2010_75]
MKTSTTIFFFFVLTMIQGQKSLDSLEYLLAQDALSQIERVDILNDLGYEYWIVDTKKSVTYGTQALQMAKDLGYIPGMAKARRIIGVSYWAQGNPKSALENLVESKTMFEEIGDDVGLANCFLNIGMVYADIDEFPKAKDLYEKAMEKFTAHDLKDRIATTYTKMADVFLAQDNLLDAKNFLDNALAIHSANNFTYGMAEAHNRLGQLFMEEGELEQAEYHIRQSMVLGKEVGDEDGKISNLVLYGHLLRLRNEFEASEAQLKLALTGADKKNLKKYKLNAFRELKLLKKQEGKLEESLEYYDQYIALKDSIYNTDKSKQIAAMEFENELREKDNQLAYLNQTKRTDSKIKWILGIGVFMITLLSISLIWSLKLRNKKQRELLVSQEKLNATIIENQRLKQIELENQLHFKNKELASYALNFVQKNELFENLHSQLKALKNASQKDKVKYFNQIEQVIRQHRSREKDWEDFKVHFEQVHSNFLTALKESFPELSSNDLKVAALARLNLNIKETSNILGISPESAKTARYRLRKKLKMTQEDDLFSFLSQWDQGS